MITLKPDGALDRRQYLARQTLDVAQEYLYEALLHDVARIVRDALPTATHLMLEVNDQLHYNQQPCRVGLLRITSPDVAVLWARDQQPSAALADYRTSEGTPWPEVAARLEQLLTEAIGTERGGMWWEPWSEDGNIVFWCKLPAVADVSAAQARQPRTLDAYLTEDDPRPWGPMWFSRPTPRPMFAVAGVAITASVDDDGVLTVEIDPTKTDPKVMRQAGPGTAIRVRLADTAVLVPFAGTDDSDGGEDELCATKSCPDRLDDGEQGARNGPDGEGDTRPGTELVLASSTLPLATAQQRGARPAPTPDAPVWVTSQLKNLLAWYEGDGAMRYRDTVEDGRHDNGRRAGFAGFAALTYAHRVGAINDLNDEDPATVISDLLGDLRHLADSLQLDFAELDRRGHGHYVPELYGEF